MKHTFGIMPERTTDPVIRLFVANWILGAVLGAICAALMLWLNVAGLGRMLMPPDHVIWEGLLLLFGGFSITFGSVVCAGAIMSLPEPDGRSDGHHL